MQPQQPLVGPQVGGRELLQRQLSVRWPSTARKPEPPHLGVLGDRVGRDGQIAKGSRQTPLASDSALPGEGKLTEPNERLHVVRGLCDQEPEPLVLSQQQWQERGQLPDRGAVVERRRSVQHVAEAKPGPLISQWLRPRGVLIHGIVQEGKTNDLRTPVERHVVRHGRGPRTRRPRRQQRQIVNELPPPARPHATEPTEQDVRLRVDDETRACAGFVVDEGWLVRVETDTDVRSTSKRAG